ncbi:hypothetical protein GQ53DRAFT_805577 [Thozetella sp. PMI_491]|nr:hypothetical protein GQ53DRAFT_805577 [Thozetella sp. PMI_491]
MAISNHLVIVCGHAIWSGGPKNGWDEAEWLIEAYKQGETPTFIEHIKAGVKILGEDDGAVLAFSGAPTRKEVNLSEARSYYNLAAANSYFGLLPGDISDPLASSRIILEERALDSYYNVLFSLIAFWRAHGAWPERITIVSHAFKKARLVDAHCGAIGFPLDRVEFVGISPPEFDPFGTSAKDIEKAAQHGEVSKDKADKMLDVYLVVGQWIEDPHGLGENLAGKRKSRNCWNVDQRLFMTDEERARSGVQTRILEDGAEILVDEAPRPWAKTA